LVKYRHWSKKNNDQIGLQQDTAIGQTGTVVKDNGQTGLRADAVIGQTGTLVKDNGQTRTVVKYWHQSSKTVVKTDSGQAIQTCREVLRALC
jgi:hypothetical protein